MDQPASPGTVDQVGDGRLAAPVWRHAQAHGTDVRLVTVGDSPLGTARILTGAAQAVPVLAAVPEDQRGADVLSGRARPGRGWTRLPLPRAARAAALRLRDELAPPPALPVVVAPRQRGTLLGRHDHTAQVPR